jgi:hypothetical protein
MSKTFKNFKGLGNRNSTRVDFVDSVFVTPTVSITDDRGIILNADNSGTTFFLATGSGFTVTLPTPAAAGEGWRAEFIVTDAPDKTPGYVISSSAGAQVLFGTVMDSAAGAMDTTTGAGKDVITFVNGEAAVGDRVSLLCDGTNFHIQGAVSAAAALTLA